MGAQLVNYIPNQLCILKELRLQLGWNIHSLVELNYHDVGIKNSQDIISNLIDFLMSKFLGGIFPSQLRMVLDIKSLLDMEYMLLSLLMKIGQLDMATFQFHLNSDKRNLLDKEYNFVILIVKRTLENN